MKTWLIKVKKFFSRKEKTDFIIYFLFLLGLFFVFNFYQQKNRQPVFGGIYREGLYEPIFSLNPLDIKNESEKAVLNIIYPPLIQFDNGKIFSKFLDKYYFSPDKLELNIELKEDLKWSDGTKITTDDLAFSFNLFKKTNLAELTFLKNAELEILDQRRAIFRLKTSDNYFIYRLTNFRLLPAKTFAGIDFENFDINSLKTGSGPFVFESLKKEKDFQVLTLTRNDYFQPKPYLDKIEFYIYPSIKRAFDGLLLKEIDGLAGLSYFNLPSVVSYRYENYKIVLPRVIGIFFNSEKIDKTTVSFLDQNLDREDLIRKVFQGNAEPSKGIFSPTLRKVFNLPSLSISSNEKIKTTPSNLDNLEIETSSTYFYPEIARYLKEKFKVNIRIFDHEKLNQIIEQKNYQAILTGINFSQPPYLFSFFSQGGLNINNLDDLDLEKKFQTLLTDSQIDLYEKIAEIEEHILAKKNNVFLVNPYYIYLIDKKIKNFDQYYLLNSDSRFVKIEYWYREK